jgi:hypothetical protein
MIKRCLELLFIAAVLTFLFVIFSTRMSELGADSPVCPQCGRTDSIVPIKYGKPGQDLMDEAREGKCVLGGCMVSTDSPKWHCQKCEHEWGTADVARESSAWWRFR